MRQTTLTRAASLIAALTTLLGVLAAAPLPAAAAGTCTVSSTDLALDSEEQALLSGINAYRQQNGLSPLKLSRTLKAAAPWYSRDMVAHNYLSRTHTDSLGRTARTRLADCGYPVSTSSTGENVVAGYANAAGALGWWKNSAPHNANLLNPAFRVAGIGRAYGASTQYGWYWTLDLGSTDDSCPPWQLCSGIAWWSTINLDAVRLP